MVQAEQALPEVLGAFDFGAPVVGAVRYGHGHINDTFVVRTQPEGRCCCRFILQRMSAAAFKRPDQLMENIINVTEYLGRQIAARGGDRSRETMEVLRPRDGRPYYTFNFLFFQFLLDIFFIYISNAIPKVPYTLPLPCSPTHPLPLLGPGIPLYWGI